MCSFIFTNLYSILHIFGLISEWEEDQARAQFLTLPMHLCGVHDYCLPNAACLRPEWINDFILFDEVPRLVLCCLPGYNSSFSSFRLIPFICKFWRSSCCWWKISITKMSSFSPDRTLPWWKVRTSIRPLSRINNISLLNRQVLKQFFRWHCNLFIWSYVSMSSSADRDGCHVGVWNHGYLGMWKAAKQHQGRVVEPFVENELTLLVLTSSTNYKPIKSQRW